MRRILTAPFTMACLILLTSSAAAGGWGLDDVASEQSDWAGYGVGTMIHLRTTSTVSMPQLPAPQETVTETKKTLVKVTDEGYVLKVESKFQDTWTTEEVVEPKLAADTPKPRVEDAGEETLNIGGEAYPCQKKRVAMTAAGEPQTVTLWVNETHGILKMADPSVGGMGWVVTKIEISAHMAGKTLTCREVEMSGGQMGLKSTMLMCPEVPERIVRIETKTQQGPAQTSSITELVAFEKK